MDVRFINPFISATSEVLEQGVQIQAVRGQISLRKSAHTTQEVTLLIHLTGQVEGMVACGMSEDTGRALVSEMTGEECSVLDRLTQGAIGELGKKIVDLAGTELSKSGYRTRVSPPRLILGRDVLISAVDRQWLVVPMDTPYGSVQICLSLQEVSARWWQRVNGDGVFTNQEGRPKGLPWSERSPRSPESAREATSTVHRVGGTRVLKMFSATH